MYLNYIYSPTNFGLSWWLTTAVNLVLGWLHCVHVGDIANISKVYATILLAQMRHQTPLFPLWFTETSTYIYTETHPPCHTSNLKMEVACTSKMLATSLTSAQCNH
jgi:hypothetical protein